MNLQKKRNEVVVTRFTLLKKVFQNIVLGFASGNLDDEC
jgi:hypothetical protein